MGPRLYLILQEAEMEASDSTEDSLAFKAFALPALVE
jgi:hypothetical protein